MTSKDMAEMERFWGRRFVPDIFRAGEGMTDEEIDAMEAGPEIDEATGKACRLEACVLRVRGHADQCLRGTDNFPEMVPFHPSTDWNDAMFAAERFGLFKTRKVDHSEVCGMVWQCNDMWASGVYDCDWGHVVHAEAPTGPLAICRAILKLARKEE
jgi:hypothetical protein